MPANDALITQLRSIVGPDGVLSDADELLVYECDGFPIAKGLPTAVVFPRETAEVSACIKAARAAGMPILPRGAGTGLAGGAVAFGEGILIVTSRMTRIEIIDVPNRVAVVQPGVRNLALTEALVGTGLRFSPDPSSQRASTIGGNAATNAGGINTLKHGVTTNHIIGMEYVTADGDIMTTRAAALYDGIGADLPAVLCGSEGTLAILTKLWCRLAPAPTNFRTVYAVFESLGDACQAVSEVTARGIVPTSMEMMDGGMIQVVEDAFHFGFPTTAKGLLLIEVDGVEAALDEQIDTIATLCNEHGATDVQRCADPARRAELWSARKKAFGAIGRISRSYCTQDACVPRSMLPQVMEEIAQIAARYDITIHNVFHAGDGNVHPIMLFDEDDPQQVQNTLRCSEAILDYCVSVGGTITGEHGVGVEKLHMMARMFTPETLNTFDRVKRAFDPDRALNDGKLIESDRLRIELLQPISSNSPGGAM